MAGEIITFFTPFQEAALDEIILPLSSLELLNVDPHVVATILDPLTHIGTDEVDIDTVAKAFIAALYAGRRVEAASIQTQLLQKLVSLRIATFTRFQSPEKARESARRLFSGRETVTPTPLNVLMRAREMTAQNSDEFSHNPVFILSTSADFRLLGIDEEWKYVLVERTSAQGNKTYELHIGSEKCLHPNMMLGKEEKAVAAGRIRFHRNTIQLNGDSTLITTEFGYIRRTHVPIASHSGLTVAKEILATMLGNRVLITIEENMGFSEPEVLAEKEASEVAAAQNPLIIKDSGQLDRMVPDATPRPFVLVEGHQSLHLRLFIGAENQRPFDLRRGDPGQDLVRGTIRRVTNRTDKAVFVYETERGGYISYEDQLKLKRHLGAMSTSLAISVMDSRTWEKRQHVSSPSPESFDVRGTIHLHEIFRSENIVEGKKINYVLVRTATGTNQLRIDTQTRPHSIMVAEGETVLAAGKIQRALSRRGTYVFIIDGDNEEYSTYAKELDEAVKYLNAQLLAAHRRTTIFVTIDFWTASDLNPMNATTHP